MKNAVWESPGLQAACGVLRYKVMSCALVLATTAAMLMLGARPVDAREVTVIVVGDWERTVDRLVPNDDFVDRDEVDNAGRGSQTGVARVGARAPGVAGHGYAQDAWVGDVRVAAVKESIRTQTWVWLGDGEGLAVVEEGALEITGEVNLEEAECAARADGFVKWDCSIMDELRVDLTQSWAQTSAETLATVDLDIGSIDLGVARGLGRYPDERVDVFTAGPECLNRFTWEVHVRGYIECWADGSPLVTTDSAHCTAQMAGECCAVVYLLPCPADADDSSQADGSES